MREHKRERNIGVVRTGLIGLGSLVVIGMLLWLGMFLMERQSAPETPRGQLMEKQESYPPVVVDGVTYHKRDGLTTMLLLGVDRSRDTVVQGYRNGGQADFLLLLVIDKKQKQITPIQIDRDTMTDIPVLSVLGIEKGSRVAQICLSHGFGDGGAQSSLLTVRAVETLLEGMPVDFHMTLNMDGISVLNDALGGVTVTLTDDFSAVDPTMTEGLTLTLQGEQAETFVRSRMSMAVGTNEARMVRQRVYMTAASELLRAKLKDNANFAGTLFDQLGEDLETDIKRGRLINEAWAARDYTYRETVQLQGEHSIGADGFMQFQPDEDALLKLVLDVFYEPAV